MEKNISTDSNSSWMWRPLQTSTSSSTPSPRYLHSLVCHNNYLYLFGGLGDNEKCLDDFWQFSLGKVTRSLTCDFPSRKTLSDYSYAIGNI